MFKGLKSIYQRRLQDDEDAAMREIGQKVWELDELLKVRLQGIALTHARARLIEVAGWANIGLLEQTGQERHEPSLTMPKQ